MRILLLMTIGVAAACAPAAERQAEAPALPDTAVVRQAIQAHGNQWAAFDMAGDAAGLVSLHTDDASVAFYGIPTTTGTTALQAMYQGYLAANKVTSAQSVVQAIAAPAPGIATARGLYIATTDSSGVVRTGWYRWAGAYRQGADGQWRVSYLMSMPDSIKVQ
ncbi:MAG TPA: nuclear transport factor 2 family protein [Gemmatimonadales bacterium]|nr:nuclear transport factor 2 family protein [Gemmatimonadales bacterium]